MDIYLNGEIRRNETGTCLSIRLAKGWIEFRDNPPTIDPMTQTLVMGAIVVHGLQDFTPPPITTTWTDDEGVVHEDIQTFPTVQIPIEGEEVYAEQTYTVGTLSPSGIKQKQYEAFIAAGYDTGLGYRLLMGQEDEAEFAKTLILLNELIAQGKAALESPFKLKDTAGVWQNLTVGQCKSVLADYGMACFMGRFIRE